MTLTVRQRARRLAALRFVEVRLMETLARWVPSTPEMEAKTLFGQHIWDHAQHADALGKRACELRAPLHHTLEPGDACREALAALAGLEETAQRIHAFYEITLNGLEAGYRTYLDATDLLMDAPSVRAVTSILMDMTRMAGESRQLREEHPHFRLTDTGWAGSVLSLDGSDPELFLPADQEASGEAS